MHVSAWAPGALRSPIRVLPSPPRGTPARIAKSRLDRTPRRSFASDAFDALEQAVHGPRKGPASSHPPPFQDDWHLHQPQQQRVASGVLTLREILLSLPPPAPPARPGDATTPATVPRERSLAPAASDERLASLVQAVQAGNTSGLLRWMTDFHSPHDAARGSGALAARSDDEHEAYLREQAARQELVASLPPTTFSEVLRSLDPFVVCDKVDVLRDICVTPSMAQLTPLGTKVTVYGVRTLYVALLKVLWSIYTTRAALPATGNGLLPSDYIVLMRAAGAASDMHMAKCIWHEMEEARHARWRQSQLYTEFIRARFLTAHLYVQNDPMRLRVQALNLHKQKVVYDAAQIYRLDRIRQQAEHTMTHLFGYNPNSLDTAEHLTRVLRKVQPLDSLYRTVLRRGYSRDTPLTAAVIVALGRNASLREVNRLLTRHWGVQVWNDCYAGREEVTSVDAPPQERFPPSADLLDAVVQAYCCNGKVSLALQLLTHLSQKFGVAVPDKTWFGLLRWAYALSSAQLAREWKIAGFPGRAIAPGTVRAVWTTMRAAPYNVQPGFAQYVLLIKSMLHEDGSVEPALRLLRQLRPLYRAQLRKQEAALRALAEIRAHRGCVQGPALLRVRRATYKKWEMWYAFHSLCLRILKRASHAQPGDALLARVIPTVVDEFRPFLLRSVWYPTPTGMVCLREPNNHAKLAYERNAFDMPLIRPAARFRHPHGADEIVQEHDRAEPEGMTIADNALLAAPGADSLAGETTPDKGAFAGIEDHSVIDEDGHVLSPANLRWLDRHVARDIRLRRVYTRRRALNYRQVYNMILGRHPALRKVLVREFA